jgi:hypothetical protein
MRKTILIPTDFTVQSLTILKTVLTNSELQYDIILLHGVGSPDSIRDLLFYSKAAHIESLSNAEFEEAFEIIRNKFHSKINSCRIDLFSGINQTAFNNYLEANRIVEIITSDDRQKLTSSKSFDLNRFINKSPITVSKIDAVQKSIIPEQGKLAEVFFNRVSVG